MKRVLWPVCGVAVALGVLLAVLLAAADPAADLPLELSKAVIALLTALMITGVLSFLLTQHNAERTRREERLKVLTGALQELKSGYERVQIARFRLGAHPTGLTLRDEIAGVSEARGRLHRVQRERWVIGTDVDRHVQLMLDYLTAITEEYKTNYRTVDEAALLEERLRKRVIAGEADYPATVATLPPDQFPRFASLLDEDSWTEDAFQTSYGAAKKQLHEWLDGGE